MSRRERINDELLVLRCQEGDSAAFAALVDRWQPRLWRHAWRLTGEENAAWDVLQEAWIAVSRGLRRLEDPAAFPAWAYRIVSRKCHDWIRREQRRRRAVGTYAQEMRPQEEQPPADDSRADDLRQALRRLPGQDRAILALRYEEEFSTAEIGEILRIPPGTVKSRLHYARERLRKYLEENDHE